METFIYILWKFITAPFIMIGYLCGFFWKRIVSLRYYEPSVHLTRFYQGETMSEKLNHLQEKQDLLNAQVKLSHRFNYLLNIMSGILFWVLWIIRAGCVAGAYFLPQTFHAGTSMHSIGIILAGSLLGFILLTSGIQTGQERLAELRGNYANAEDELQEKLKEVYEEIRVERNRIANEARERANG